LKEIFGRKIPTTIEELVDPAHTAVAVVDAQNDFCVEGGRVNECGGDLKGYPETIKNIGKLIEEARRAGVLVVYIQLATLPNHASESAATLRFRMKAYGDPEKIPAYALEGTWGQQIVDEIKPTERDTVMKKNRASGFMQTNLDLVLRCHGIKTLVVAGFATNGCVFATVRDGLDLDYFVVAAKDCMNSVQRDLHEATLKLMESRCDVFTSDNIVEVWRSKI
jgi:nicotinamidase-related amidase